MNIQRKWAMPSKNTFSIKPINELVMKYAVEDIESCDPFANKNRIAKHCNDLDPQYNTEHCMDAIEFLKQFPDDSMDLVLFDPPYSPRQVSECYKSLDMTVNMQTTQSSFWGNLKKEIHRVIKTNGIVITFGWNSGGIGKTKGFAIEEILIVPHGGWHNDTICTVERLTYKDRANPCSKQS
jgi:hypothetical protein